MCILRADIPRKSGFPLQGKEPGKNLNQSGLYHLVLAAGHSAAFIAGCHTRDVFNSVFCQPQPGCGHTRRMWIPLHGKIAWLPAIEISSFPVLRPLSFSNCFCIQKQNQRSSTTWEWGSKQLAFSLGRPKGVALRTHPKGIHLT